MKQIMKATIGLLAICLCLALTESAAATIVHVPGDQPTIQGAIGVAGDGDTVKVGSGLYNESLSLFAKDIVLLGDTVDYSVTLRPALPGESVITLTGFVSRSTEIVGLTIEFAFGAPGIVCQVASPTIRKNRIQNNIANSGGGILFTSGSLALVMDNEFRDNQAYDGAGILMSGGAADVIDNLFERNRATSLGGGIACQQEGAHTIEGNQFIGNYAGAGGGGISFEDGAPVTVRYNLFVDDTSNHGGGLQNIDRDFLEVTNNTFDRCVAGIGNGGGNAVWWVFGADQGGVVKDNIFANTTTGGNPIGGAFGGDEAIVNLVLNDYNLTWNNSPVDYYRFSSGPNAVSGDPEFCDAGALNYELFSLSMAVGSGEAGGNIGAFGIGCFPCDCPFQADLNADSFQDAVDLNALIDALFFNGPNPQDQSCPVERGNFNCDVQLDAVDLSEMIDFLYFQGAAACDPCAGI